MGKHFALALQVPLYKTEQKKKKTPARRGLKTSHIGFALFFACCALVLAYLIQVNGISTKGYEIGNLQGKIGDLQTSYQNLEVKAAQLQSIQRLQSDPEIAAMVPVTSITYIQEDPILTQR